MFRILERNDDQVTDCGVWSGFHRHDALNALAQSVGYVDFSEAQAKEWKNVTFEVSEQPDNSEDT